MHLCVVFFPKERSTQERCEPLVRTRHAGSEATSRPVSSHSYGNGAHSLGLKLHLLSRLVPPKRAVRPRAPTSPAAAP